MTHSQTVTAPIGSPLWDQQMAAEFDRPYMHALQAFLLQQSGPVYPPDQLRFEAFRQTPFNRVKVIILGQDPYHGDGQAHGLSFSVNRGQPIPPSLRNIYQELHSDLGVTAPGHGDLSAWARQGVLLLNSTLTVSANTPASHQKQGWEIFTGAALQALNDHGDHLVFMLWGKAAAAKAPLLDDARHLVLTAPHPSPLSAYRGFFGCRHFSLANQWLQQHGKTPINWQLPA